ncbi:uncharacterized protein TRIVIDRAFT_229558 [Trichoderma virens Gv29-8]|uniref:Uncharacterized protein n=1 Tax=Hypocrea virens (strain Gv29-8 / FGSC 10586) TaxID=413071 RepID=G9MIJ3_HYPVG|nr:uncharacterized protein TRIVIDRAFT_229558 [Trichoderma virens Gv29-8]EHK25310.1 hypothetical protein TRIVIDRAFT_229558 [Trichoderma virens Gv29-8]UKZ48867.1 hypothetical protein TrVGV298_003103 [Trichoderma virens]
MGILDTRRRPFTYHILHRKWPRVPRLAIRWLMLAEFIGLVPILTIFGLSQPDLYRSAMWKIGWDHRLNSNPDIILFAYANHVAQPKLPLIWSRTLTDYNVAISVISLFFLLTKLIAVIMRIWYPVLSTLSSIALVVLYAVSVYGQVGRDYTDPRYPAPAAWYFRYGCDMAKPYGQYTNCQIAQGSLFITLYMLTVYLIVLGFSLYCMWPNPLNNLDTDEDEDDEAPSIKEGKSLEMSGWPTKTPMASGAMPFTPRTQAFHILDRKLPLRQEHEAMIYS